MLDLFLSNPLNLVLLMPLVYVLYTAIYPPLPPKGARRPTSHEAGYDWMPAEHPESVLYRQYTARELAPFDGKEDKDGKPGKILLAIERRERVRNAEGGWNMERKERTVFDVSAGRSFYDQVGGVGVSMDLNSLRRCRRPVRQLCRAGRKSRNGYAVL